MNLRRRPFYFFVVFVVFIFAAGLAWAQDRDAIIAKAKEEKDFVYMRSRKNILLSNRSCFVSAAHRSLSKFSRSTAAVPICSM
ncbi:MAG: hypothetical protein HW373_660 [Deltaproteobacteria bacterium]|nr:hypothetical protein [Deltaproteobacteria bacterium]